MTGYMQPKLQATHLGNEGLTCGLFLSLLEEEEAEEEEEKRVKRVRQEFNSIKR